MFTLGIRLAPSAAIALAAVALPPLAAVLLPVALVAALVAIERHAQTL